ncbi:MAG: cation transporter [Pontiellaceae bacterium]|nr:cation transporter [Pontiellaceae bacterium]MBN2784432.1 cation transporter [Pontiellaceae bacterium]
MNRDKNLRRDAAEALRCPVMKLLLSRVVQANLPPDCHENRTRLGMLAGWTSVVLSVVLASVKGWLGLVSGSASMLADATNNLTDVGSSLVIALGFQWSRKPRDEKHPFGHGRIEAVATLVLAIALILVGVEVAQSGISRLVHPKPIEAPGWILVTVGLSILVKSWMAVFARGLARLTRSHALEADAWNHTFDIICTLMVVVALICSRFGWGALDGWMAIGVALFILYTGITYAREAIDHLLGEKPNPMTLRRIYSTVIEVEGVMGAHDIMVHQYGDVYMVSLHVEVDANLSLVEAHRISEEAEAAVEQQLGWRAVAHVDPVDRSHVLFEELSHVLKAFVASEARLVDVHDLRAEGMDPPYRISFDLVTDMDTVRREYDEIYSSGIAMLNHAFSGRVDEVEIGIEAVVESAPMSRRVVHLGRDETVS